ncbi:hypothetical protein [uncultured Gammaproteobacteria bacterium]|nr:hypothetical protein [uncultured Gammaproteobacteria bacterium]
MHQSLCLHKHLPPHRWLRKVKSIIASEAGNLPPHRWLRKQ